MKNFTIISDPGVDDLIALSLLNKLTPKSKNMAISSFGNVPVKYTNKNIKEFIECFAPGWSYKKGPAKPIKKLDRPWPTYFHGSDGAWGVHPKKTNNNIENKFSKIYPDFISLAPMTVAADFLGKQKIENITIMGGAFNVSGNETIYSETNIAFDPEAAAYFFNNCQNIKVQVIPLDVTKKVSWQKNFIDKIPEDSLEKIWAKKLLLAWFKNYGDKKTINFDLHDPLAVYSIFFPENFEWQNSGVKVAVNGKKRGQTIFSKSNPCCKIATGIKNPDKAAKDMFNIIFDTIV
jgi:purine nucleosidase